MALVPGPLGDLERLFDVAEERLRTSRPSWDFIPEPDPSKVKSARHRRAEGPTDEENPAFVVESSELRYSRNGPVATRRAKELMRLLWAPLEGAGWKVRQVIETGLPRIVVRKFVGMKPATTDDDADESALVCDGGKFFDVFVDVLHIVWWDFNEVKLRELGGRLWDSEMKRRDEKIQTHPHHCNSLAEFLSDPAVPLEGAVPLTLALLALDAISIDRSDVDKASAATIPASSAWLGEIIADILIGLCDGPVATLAKAIGTPLSVSWDETENSLRKGSTTRRSHVRRFEGTLLHALFARRQYACALKLLRCLEATDASGCTALTTSINAPCKFVDVLRGHFLADRSWDGMTIVHLVAFKQPRSESERGAASEALELLRKRHGLRVEMLLRSATASTTTHEISAKGTPSGRIVSNLTPVAAAIFRYDITTAFPRVVSPFAMRVLTDVARSVGIEGSLFALTVTSQRDRCSDDGVAAPKTTHPRDWNPLSRDAPYPVTLFTEVAAEEMSWLDQPEPTAKARVVNALYENALRMRPDLHFTTQFEDDYGQRDSDWLYEAGTVSGPLFLALQGLVPVVLPRRTLTELAALREYPTQEAIEFCLFTPANPTVKVTDVKWNQRVAACGKHWLPGETPRQREDSFFSTEIGDAIITEAVELRLVPSSQCRYEIERTLGVENLRNCEAFMFRKALATPLDPSRWKVMSVTKVAEAPKVDDDYYRETSVSEDLDDHGADEGEPRSWRQPEDFDVLDTLELRTSVYFKNKLTGDVTDEHPVLAAVCEVINNDAFPDDVKRALAQPPQSPPPTIEPHVVKHVRQRRREAHTEEVDDSDADERLREWAAAMQRVYPAEFCFPEPPRDDGEEQDMPPSGPQPKVIRRRPERRQRAAGGDRAFSAFRRYVPIVACEHCGLPGVLERIHTLPGQRAEMFCQLTQEGEAMDATYCAQQMHSAFMRLLFIVKLRETVALGFRLSRGAPSPTKLTYDVLGVIASFLYPQDCEVADDVVQWEAVWLWGELAAGNLVQVLVREDRPCAAVPIVPPSVTFAPLEGV